VARAARGRSGQSFVIGSHILSSPAPPHDVLSTDPRRARWRRVHRALLWRTRSRAGVGGRWFRQAAPDDGAALHHRLHRRQPRLLGYAEVRTLGLRAAAVIGGLWLLALSFAFLIPLTFPSVENASFFSSSLVERQPPFDFVDLYIPANPFHSLANNVVPAVVLFSVILGVALVGVEHKERLLDVLQVARDAIARATRLVTRLTPYGLFAIAANAAGTLGLEQLSRLQVYLVAYVAVALIVSL